MPGETIEFEQGGVRVSGYLARPEGEARAGMIVIQEWWGLNDDIKEIADRYAGEGYLALAPDMYHGRVTEEPDDARKLAMALERPQAAREIDAAVAWLKEAQGIEKVGCVGFCMGGGLTLATALRPSSQIDAAHVYYGGGMPEDADLDQLEVPVMGSYGSDERERGEGLRDRLAAAGIEHDVKIYDGGHHGFFNRFTQEAASEEDRPVFLAAAEDSWERSKRWFGEHLGREGDS